MAPAGPDSMQWTGHDSALVEGNPDVVGSCQSRSQGPSNPQARD